MRALAVIYGAPAVQFLLHVLLGSEASSVQYFSLQRTVKPLVLAVGLRVVRPAVTDADTQPDQPDGQFGELPRTARRTPRRAVIGIDA